MADPYVAPDWTPEQRETAARVRAEQRRAARDEFDHASAQSPIPILQFRESVHLLLGAGRPTTFNRDGIEAVEVVLNPDGTVTWVKAHTFDGQVREPLTEGAVPCEQCGHTASDHAPAPFWDGCNWETCSCLTPCEEVAAP